jgi:hypothetical protein
MDLAPPNAATDLAAAVQEYQKTADVGTLFDRVRRLAESVGPEELAAAAGPFRDVPEVVIPIYERLIAAKPNDAQTMVVLANAYWLTGRGPDAVGELASRAIAADPTNRGAWHLWALSESSPHERMTRWLQVTQRFPEDELAKANLADNATSIASADRDREAWQIALHTYRSLLRTATRPEQRTALEEAIGVLEKWNF